MVNSARLHRRKSRRPYAPPMTVDDLTEQNVRSIVEMERAAKRNRTWPQRVAHRIAALCGTIHFVWLHVVWFGAWVLFNSWPGIEPVDPFPFTFLTLLVSLEAIFLSTFILISQNEETRLAERRNALDLQINLLTEQENTKLLELVEAIARKLDVPYEDDPTLSVLEQATQPEKLAEQIDRATGRVTDPA